MEPGIPFLTRQYDTEKIKNKMMGEEFIITSIKLNKIRLFSVLCPCLK